jgi:RiboL-PSP-HEPN
MEFKLKLDALKQQIASFEEKYIKHHLPADPSEDPEEYDLDVKSYFILSHAAFEEYFESIALKVVSIAEEKWILHKTPTKTAMAIFLFTNIKFKIPDDDEPLEDNLFNIFRKQFGECKRKFSNDITKNHGCSPKYLKKILLPAGIDFQPDTNALNSFTQLARNRGQYAHKGSARNILVPEDALDFVNDCLEFAEKIQIELSIEFNE